VRGLLLGFLAVILALSFLIRASLSQASPPRVAQAQLETPTGTVIRSPHPTPNCSLEMEWSRTFGGPYGDFGHSVQQTSDSGFIIAGWTDSFGAGGGDVYLIKTDTSGNEQWSTTFGGPSGDYAYSVQQTSDSGFIIAGWTDSFGAGGGDVYLIKVAPARGPVGGIIVPTDKLGLIMPWIIAAALIVVAGVSLAIWNKKRGAERASDR